MKRTRQAPKTVTCLYGGEDFHNQLLLTCPSCKNTQTGIGVFFTRWSSLIELAKFVFGTITLPIAVVVATNMYTEKQRGHDLADRRFSEITSSFAALKTSRQLFYEACYGITDPLECRKQLHQAHERFVQSSLALNFAIRKFVPNLLPSIELMESVHFLGDSEYRSMWTDYIGCLQMPRAETACAAEQARRPDLMQTAAVDYISGFVECRIEELFSESLGRNVTSGCSDILRERKDLAFDEPKKAFETSERQEMDKRFTSILMRIVNERVIPGSGLVNGAQSR